MDSTKLKGIIIALIAAFVALWLGLYAATAQLETIAFVATGTLFLTCLLLGNRVYLIIPFLSALALVLPLPGRFSTGFIGLTTFLGFTILLYLIRRITIRVRFTELEFWILLLSVCVIQAFVRNPVGLDILGTETVGAKPYAIFAIYTFSAAILACMSVNPKDIKIWTYLILAGSVLNFTIGAIGFFIPTIGYYLVASFTADLGGKAKLDAGSTFRISFVKSFSENLALWISSRKSPLSASFHPLWAPLVLLSMALAGASGYRAQMILIGLVYFIGVCYRGGFRSVVVSCMIGVMALIFISIVNAIAPLPLNIQRSLSGLPGTWDQAVVNESEVSSNWRIEIWKDALFTERWIRNKTLGDGLGFTREELNRIHELEMDEYKNRISRIGLTHQQVSYLINGNYHSGPVHTIRAIGYVGLVVLLLAMYRLGVHAHRQIKRCRGTEWYSTSLFLGIPLLVMPIHWTFIIGSFESATIWLMMGIAVVRMMEENLPLPPYRIPSRFADLPPRPKTVNAPT